MNISFVEECLDTSRFDKVDARWNSSSRVLVTRSWLFTLSRFRVFAHSDPGTISQDEDNPNRRGIVMGAVGG